MTIQTVLNVTQTALVIDTAGHLLGSREPYLYDDSTISAANFAILQAHLNGGRLRLLTGGVTIPSPSQGASFVSVAIQGQNLVFTDSLGGTSTVAVPGGDVDLTPYVRVDDLEAVPDIVLQADLTAAITPVTTALGTKVNSSTYTAGIATVTQAATDATTAAQAAATAVAGKADVAATLGVTVLPSGDQTGVTDVAAINTALVAGDVTLRGTYYTLGAIKMPSDRTLTLYNAEVRRINDKGSGSTTTNCNIVTNLNMDATGNSNILVRGIGKASFRLHSSTAGYVRNAGTISAYFGFYWVNVTGLTVQDVSIGPTRAFTSNIQVCKNVAYRNVRCNQDRLAENQDGLDIGPGCSNVVFDGITGVTSDDGFSIYAQNTSGSLHPYTTSLTTSQRNVTDIDVRNVQMDVGINVFRFQAGDGSQLKRVTMSNITNLRAASIGVNADTAAVLQFGSTNYVNANPATTDFSDFALTGYKGKSTWLIGADSNFSNVRVSAVNLQDAESLIGYRGMTNKSGGTYVPQFNNVTIDGVVLSNANATEPTLMTLPVTQAVDNITIRNITADTLKYLLRNQGTVTNLSLANVKVTTITGATFGSTVAETGSATNIEILGYGGSATGVYRGVASRLMLRNTPYVRSTDIAPSAVSGSQLTFAAGLDPTGGGSTAAGVYVADGTAWNRLLALANDPAAAVSTPPATPTGLALSGTPTPTSATFTFNTVTGATSYPYRVRTVGSTTWLDRTVTNATSPFTATSLTAGQNYEIQLAAAGPGGTSAYTASVTFSTTTSSTPNAYTTSFPTQSTTSIPGFTTLAASNPGIVDANGAGLTGTPGVATWYFTSDNGQPAVGQDQHARIVIGAKATAANLSPIAFIRNTGSPTTAATFNLILARWNGATSLVELFKIVAGASTSLGTVAQATLPTSLDVKAVGTSVSVYVNDSTTAGITATITDSALSSGKCGIGFRYTAAGDLVQRITAFSSGDAS